MDVITSHQNADFDTFASMIAARRLYPGALLVFSGSLEKDLRDSIGSFDLPFRFDSIKDIDLEKVSRLIIVDARQAGRIGRFAEIIGRPGVEVHIYDHHPQGEGDIHGALEVIRPYGSTTTVLTLILKERSVEITPQEATIFMAGIYEDTGFLSYPSTTVSDFEAAGFLLSAGADLRVVTDLLKKELTPEEVALLNEFLQSQTTYTIGGADIVIAEGYLERYVSDISGLAHRIRDIEGMDCLFMLVDSEDRVHIIARSRTPAVDVGRVARAVGGGGHPNAASATLKGVTLIEAKEILLKALRENIVPHKTAEDIMSYPAITLGPDVTLKKAVELMRRYNINAAPVVGGRNVSGVITRQVVDKAVFHGLGHAPVSDYMTTDIEWVEHSTSIDEIREKVVGHGQRLLPVLKDGLVAGVITRTDLLKLLQDGLRETNGKAQKPRHLSRLMRERLPAWAFGLLKEAGDVAQGLGVKAYAVGGFVRDLLLRRDNLDIDIVIEGGDGIAFANEFAARRGLKVRPHHRFRTAVVVFPDGFKMDVATARLEYYERPGALPTVEESSLKLDLYRRDFIINTLAVSLNPGKFGELIDFFGAQKDIKEKVIRVLHNLSFVEDPTRMLRAVRFSEKFGFKIGKHTLNLIKNSVRIDVFTHLSGPRLLDELRNILEEEAAYKPIRRLHELGLLGLIHRSILWDSEREHFLERAVETLTWHQLLYMKEMPERWLVLFLSLTDTLNEQEYEGLIARLLISGRKRCRVLGNRSDGLRALGRLELGLVKKNSEIYDLFSATPLEIILYLMAKAKGEETRRSLSTYITRLRETRPMLTGTDLKALGVEEGASIGEVLRELLKKRLDNELITKEDEVAFVKREVSHKRR